MNMYCGTHEEIRGQLVGDSFLLPLGGTWELNSRHQAWWQESYMVNNLSGPSI